jgi:hypothetical protein
MWHHRASMPKLALPVLASPLVRRVVWHVRRVGGQLDRRFFLSLAEGIPARVARQNPAVRARGKKSGTSEPDSHLAVGGQLE